MHYYTWNIGDYSSHANHLNIIEDCAYRRLLDRYYLSESAIPLDVSVASRLIGMREYQSEVEIVLREFFSQTESGWVNKRAELEIAHYKGKVDQASRAGKASAERRSNASPTGVERALNARTTDEQPTINHKPVTINHHKEKHIFALPDWMPLQAWKGFAESRKAGKGPFTDRAKQLIVSQLQAMQMQGQDVSAVLDQSTANGWKGVFPVKQQGEKNAKYNPAPANRLRIDELLQQELATELAQRSVGPRIAQASFDDLPS